jgi:hypothetical protein
MVVATNIAVAGTLGELSIPNKTADVLEWLRKKLKQPGLQFQGKIVNEETRYSVFATPTEEEDEDKSVGGLFADKKVSLVARRKTLYTPEYRDYRWKAQFDPVTGIETKYTKDLKNLFYKMRQQQLASLMQYGGQAAIQASTLEALQDEPMWSSYNKDLEAITRANLTLSVDVTGNELLSLFGDIGLDVGIGWDIWDTRAKDMLEYRVHRVTQVDDTIRAGIREKLGYALENGWSIDETADVLRETYNIAQNRAPTIARTEIAGAINDSREAAFIEEGFQKHMWITARDMDVRGNDPADKYDHTTSEGEIRTFGDAFPCGLTRPHDPAGDAGNVINCRCDTLPVFEE